MATPTPPSYHEATARQDWLRLASPYIDFADYRALCLADRRCWSIFAPLLWLDIFKSASRSGPATADGGERLAAILAGCHWWPRFVFDRLAHVRPVTRSLVRILDLRDLAEDPSLAFVDTSSYMQQSLRRALELLPNVTSLLLDGHLHIDPCFLSSVPRQELHRGLSQLSVKNCAAQLSHTFFHSPCLRHLVFLDISGLSGSIGCILSPAALPHIRILKIRNRELDDRTCVLLINTLGRRLWSLDLSGNKLTDSIIESLIDVCLPPTDLRDDDRFQVEGKLVRARQRTQQHGDFCFIQESPWSESFSHPERYLIDTPSYRRAAQWPEAGDASGRRNATRLPDCRSPPPSDFADPVSQLLLGAQDPLAAVDRAPASSRGLTHLSLSDNNISALGVDRLLRDSGGHLSYFACDTMPLLPAVSAYQRVWPRSARLHGIVGREHVFRPVIASNLQVLRIHHSIVTNIPTLEMDGLSRLARTLVSETLILPRVDQAFPLTLVPDANPRLTSLTLTCIPRSSTGPLIERLIAFLKLLSSQECSVRDAQKMFHSPRSFNVLRGLRHLRLEFEPEASAADSSVNEDLDAAALLNSGDVGFSFFAEDRFAGPHAGPHAGPESGVRASVHPGPTQADAQSVDSDGPETVQHSAHWEESPFSIEVWAGSPTLAASNAHIREYRRLVLSCHIREGAGPVTPGQIRAGAPPNGYIFHGTWCMAVMPQGTLPVPRASETAAMKNVVKALWDYRQEGLAQHAKMERELGKGRVDPGEPHWFWRGKMEVMC